MEEQLISFETAKLAKEKGFNISSLHNYSEYLEDDIFDNPRKGHEITLHKKGEVVLSVGYPDVKYKSWQAPTQSLLQKWLREEHNIEIEITKLTKYYYRTYKGDLNPYTSNNAFPSKTYEEALEKGLQEALKLIK